MSKREIFVFIGAPGSGKGSLAQKCVAEFNWVPLSTGSLCRKHIAEGTDIGKRIDFAIKSGKLISDDIIIEMVKDWLLHQDSSVRGVILDGFPRTVSQAQALDDLLSKTLKNCDLHIIKLTVPDADIITRLSGRLVCSNKDCQAVYSDLEGSPSAPKKSMVCNICGSSLAKRLDDDSTTVQKRLQTYYAHEKPLLDYYQHSAKPVYELDAHDSLQKVFEKLKQLVVVQNAVQETNL